MYLPIIIITYEPQVSVLFCTSAAGTFSKPFVIYPGIRPKYNFDEVDQDDYDIGHSLNGWISADSFFGWFANLFYKSVVNNVAFPILVLMDGHSAHMNLPIAEFCQAHGIILYCLLPHSSHMLQPLDVAVFKTVKSQWNESLEKFQKKHRMAMKRFNFFQVFDECWKKARSPENAVSGFRKCGLVPFDPEAVPYGRLVRKAANQPLEKRLLCEKEKIGIMRAQQLFQTCLTPNIKDLFNVREEEGYNIQDDTPLGVLWKFHSKIGKLLNFDEPNNQEGNEATTDSPSLVAPASPPPLPAPASPPPLPAPASPPPLPAPASPPPLPAPTSPPPLPAPASPTTSPPTNTGVFVLNECTITDVSGDLRNKVTSHQSQSHPDDSGNSIAAELTINVSSSSISPSSSATNSTATGVNEPSTSNVPSTSSSRAPASASTSYDYYNQCPFKNHLKISDNVVISRKTPVSKAKYPFAISGTEYIDMMRKKQEGKEKELLEKEKRKAEREAKSKQKKAKKQRVEHEIILETDSEDLDMEETNVCRGCNGGEGWNDPSLWIGCSGSNCNCWFHKTCISNDVTAMNNDELNDYELFCETCEAKMRNTARRQGKK